MRKIFYLFFLVISLPLVAKPSGFKPVSGKVKPPIQDASGAMVIESGPSAIVHWDSFSIAANETVQFNQADARSAILNRVVGFEPSLINGALLSNGKVFLVNQNGLLIGPNGRIVASSFIGSTLDLLDSDFLEGKELLFQGSSDQGIDHFGTIVAREGDCILLAPKINQEGSISAPHGHAILGAGQAILLRPSGNERILIRVPTDASIQNSGNIKALVTEIKSGVNSYSKAIQSSGRIEATRSVEREGRVFLVAEGGLAELSGQITAEGGEVRLLGQEVALIEEARIDVSGESRGGTVLIGGDFQGKNPDVLNAKNTFVGPDVQIFAHAPSDGDGGKVIVWGDEITRFYGNIDASAQKGDGGFVEVSGKYLDFNGFADRRAPNGKAGELLLDPINITISSGADSNNAFIAPNYTFTGCPTSNINTTNLITNIDAGNVTISTSGTGSGCGQAGTINVNSNTIFNSPHTLTLVSDSDFTFLPAGVTLQNSGTGLLNMIVGGNLVMDNTGGGTNEILLNFDLSSGSFIDVAGNLILTADSGTGQIALDLGSNSVLTVGGNLLMTASTSTTAIAADQINVSGSLEASGTNVNVIESHLNTTLNVQGNINLNSQFFIQPLTSASITVTAGQSINLLNNDSFQSAGSVLVIAGDSITLANTSLFRSTSGNVTAVVDNASACGTGAFNIDSTSGLTTQSAGSAIRVFTAKRDQNTISGAAMFDNDGSAAFFTPGPFNVDSATEQWSTKYPSSIGGNPFTIFYKEPNLCSPSSPPTPVSSSIAITQVSIANTAVTQILNEPNPVAILTLPTPLPGDIATPLAIYPNILPTNNSIGISECY